MKNVQRALTKVKGPKVKSEGRISTDPIRQAKKTNKKVFKDKIAGSKGKIDY